MRPRLPGPSVSSRQRISQSPAPPPHLFPAHLAPDVPSTPALHLQPLLSRPNPPPCICRPPVPPLLSRPNPPPAFPAPSVPPVLPARTPALHLQPLLPRPNPLTNTHLLAFPSQPQPPPAPSASPTSPSPLHLASFFQRLRFFFLPAEVPYPNASAPLNGDRCTDTHLLT